MKKYLSIIIIIIIMLVLVCQAGPVFGQEVGVEAEVDKNVVASGEALALKVSIQGGDGDVAVSGIRDFEVVPRGTSRQYSIVNGEATASVHYTYRLEPLKEGRLLIPPLPVTVDGKTFYTEMIEVMAGKNEAEENGDQSGAAPPDLFTKISVSDSNPYVGEQIACRVTLYKADSIRIANAGLTEKPDFKGFSVEQVEDNRSFTRSIDGRRYRATEVVYILTPESAGAFEVGPAVITCEVLVQKGQSGGSSPFDSFFNDSFFGRSRRLEPRRLRADPVTVIARPLPEFEGTGAFSGLVGEFDLSAEIEETTLERGDSTSLRVVVSGKGNIGEAEILDLDIPEEFKVYKDSPRQDIAVSEAGISGKKIFSRALVALTPGEYELGPFSLNYFDVNREDYVTAVTEPLAITVNPGPSSDEEATKSDPDRRERSGGGPASGEPAAGKQAVEFTGRDIFPLKQGLEAVENQGRLPWWLFAVLVTMPLLIYLVAAVVFSRWQRRNRQADIMGRRARAVLKQAASRDDKGHEFLDALYKAIVYAVYARSGRKGEALTDREAETLLSGSGCDERLAGEVQALFREIEQRRYGGEAIDPDRARTLLAEVKGVVRRLIS
ncbi:MAG: BatD family protein [Desulfosudaceae bacterium]